MTRAGASRTTIQVNEKNCNLEREYRDCIKKQKRQDWDHKAYHDAPITS